MRPINILKALTAVFLFLYTGLPAGAQEPLLIQYATANPEGSSHLIYIRNFKRLLEKYSNGKMTIAIHANGIKGSEHDNLMDVSDGTLDMTTLAVNNITIYAPIVGFMTLPYMFPTQKKARRLFLTENKILHELNQKMIKAANIRALSWLNSGYRVLTNSRKIIRTPLDLKGLNIRVPDNPIMVATYRAWGVEPVPLVWTKTFKALENNVIDGHDNAYLGHKNMPHADRPFYEIQKHITEIHYILLILGHIVNEDFFQRLSPEQRAAIKKAAGEAAEEEWNWVENQNKKILKEFINKGMVLTRPADNEKEWILKGRSVWKDFYKKIGGRDFVDKVTLFLEEKP